MIVSAQVEADDDEHAESSPPSTKRPKDVEENVESEASAWKSTEQQPQEAKRPVTAEDEFDDYLKNMFM